MEYHREPTWGTDAFPPMRPRHQCKRCVMLMPPLGSAGTGTCRYSALLFPHTTTSRAPDLAQHAMGDQENNGNSDCLIKLRANHISVEISRNKKRGRLVSGLSLFLLVPELLVWHRENIIADRLIQFYVFDFEFREERALWHLQPLCQFHRHHDTLDVLQ